ncbi:MAG TPA: amidohydrolase family protein [Chloroflexota bacterium]|nr:amidohydrolase family protein [Chloroflexota bacterium]HZU07094.1 amidohydrolase family protein [Chloroflexota bacterium]
MPTIDADAHVIESERTWDYIDDSLSAFKPRVVRTTTPLGTETEWWLIDGRIQPKQANIGQDTSEESREMRDIEARLRHMDELGVDIQVLYPSLFLRPLTNRPDLELALCQSYNRWLRDIWLKGKNRLRWAAVLPLLSMNEALAELRFAKQNGACAVFMRGVEGHRRVVDPYFYPLYEEAQRLDMPICIHASNGSFDLHDYYIDEPGFCRFKLPCVGAFHSLIFSEVPSLFPKLRFGFIELSAQWVPYAIHDLARRFARRGKQLPSDLLEQNRIYVACQTDDDLAYILRYTGEDHLVIGSDYGHADTSSEIEALRRLRERGEVSPAVINKILDDNARALYAL